MIRQLKTLSWQLQTFPFYTPTEWVLWLTLKARQFVSLIIESWGRLIHACECKSEGAIRFHAIDLIT